MKKPFSIVASARIPLFILIILIAIGTIFIPQNKDFNSDLTKYLGAESSVRQGLDIYEEEFGALPASATQIRIMGENLASEETKDIVNTLQSLENVTSVNYHDDDEAYHKDGYSLFIVKTDASTGSEEFAALTNAIETGCASNYNLVVEYGNENAISSVSPLTLGIIAGVFLILLFLFSKFWIEPVLVLLAMALSAFLQVRTNGFFHGLSTITNSVALPVPLLLTAHFSSILINRYHIDRPRFSDKKDALSFAVKNSYSQLLGCTLTTIASLCGLFFLPFTMGKELAMILSKGVVISFLCVLTFLPFVLYILDGALLKTYKKPLAPKMAGISYFFHKTRFVYPILIVVITSLAFFLKTKAAETYSLPSASQIDPIFPKSNAIVVLYDNDDEKNMEAVIDSLEAYDDVSGVTSYYSILAKTYTADEMGDKIKELAGDINIEPWIIEFVYYDYAGGAIEPLSLDEFLTYFIDFVNANPAYSSFIDEATMEKLDLLSLLANKDELNKQRSAAEIGSILGVDSSYIEKAFSLMKKDTMSIVEIRETLEKIVNLYNKITPAIKEKMDFISLFTDPTELNKQRTPAELSSIFGVNEKAINIVMLVARRNTISIQELLDLVHVDSALFQKLPAAFQEKIKQVMQFVNGIDYEKIRSIEEIADMLGIDVSFLESIGSTSTSIKEIYEYIKKLSTMDLSFIDWDLINLIQTVMDDTLNDKTYTPEELTDLFGSFSAIINKDNLTLLYKLYYSQHTEIDLKLSLEELLNHVTEMSKSSEYGSLFSDDMKDAIRTASKMLADGKAQLVGENHSILLLDVNLAEGSPALLSFIEDLDADLQTHCSSNYYMMGYTIMQYEMSQSFQKNMNFIMLITLLAVCAIAFVCTRNIAAPFLAAAAQASIFLSMWIMGKNGNGLYFIFLFVLQCLVLGFVVNFGILLACTYRKEKKFGDSVYALSMGYETALRFIGCYGVFFIFVVFYLVSVFNSAMLSQILCLVVGCGEITFLLTLIALPGTAALFAKS